MPCPGSHNACSVGRTLADAHEMPSLKVFRVGRAAPYCFEETLLTTRTLRISSVAPSQGSYSSLSTRR